MTVGPDDWKSWREIRLRALRQDPEAFGSTHEREAAFTEPEWRYRLDGASGPSVLAYAGDELVGIGAGWLYEPGRLMVVAMWTEPDRRGAGIGRQVLDHVVGWARERDLPVELWVADDNPAARRLYERYGFRPDGRTEPIREGSDATMSHLVLPG
ncbi:GNAT family N-acetyltransferase [Micromonospora sp. WMMD1102]|uniref:GNAT family N-acetyltransferase n=1 Tax=Micromonospora sp. WMMD1102 TaxID=3016105 RepID=UPI002414ED41|nr:GNAT family N-acetyltransferase [Micromonospora sp. WMMD1102]MDG4791256.1 GNAT family N-acetyltransferase [Micromonospora sp. WMMD1102]